MQTLIHLHMINSYTISQYKYLKLLSGDNA